jgi:hypothetical protein
MATALRALSVLAAAVLAAATAVEPPVSITFDFSQAPGPYNSAVDNCPGGGLGCWFVPLNISAPPLVREVHGNDAEQVHITHISCNSVVVSWSSGAPQQATNGTLTSNPYNSTYDIRSIIPLTQPGNLTRKVVYGTGPHHMKQSSTNQTAYLHTMFLPTLNINSVCPGNATLAAADPDCYEQLYNYTSGVLHNVYLNGLHARTTYFYKIEDTVDTNLRSQNYFFTTTRCPGPTSTPQVIAVWGDQGQTINASNTMAHILDHNPDYLVNTADWTYADNHLSNDTYGADLLTTYVAGTNNAVKISKPSQYNPGRWDSWFRLMEPLMSRVPNNGANGNHDTEQASIDGIVFPSYTARVPTPYIESGSPSHQFFSTNVGNIHFVYLTSYEDYTLGSTIATSSAQIQWLISDLSAVDRTLTPWIIAINHNPWYHTYSTHYKENECQRFAFEPILYAYGVDIMLNGHVHSYERSNPVYNYAEDPCGIIHILVGNAGNEDGRPYFNYTDDNFPANCNGGDPTLKTLSATNYNASIYFPSYCPGGPFYTGNPPPYAQNFGDLNGGLGSPQTLQNGTFCQPTQPPWSAYRSPNFGHAIMDVDVDSNGNNYINWAWYDNKGMSSQINDNVVITKRPSTCANAAKPANFKLQSYATPWPANWP